MRVISLLASGTEIVCALGAGDSLVGRSHECDNPAWVRALPACSEPAFDVTQSSREIDAEVTRRIRSGEPMYRLDMDLIRELAPDLLIAQEHCEVCAVTPGDVQRSQSDRPFGQVLALSAGSMEDIFAGMRQVAEALGLEERGHAVVRTELDRLEAVRARVAGRSRPSVVVIEWTDPLYPMGNWGPELVDIAGGELLIANRDQHSAAVPADQVRAADPEVLIVAPCGFDLARALRDRPVLESCSWWSQLRAVRSGKVAFADGNLFFNRSGMTVSQTAEMIAEILHGVTFGGVTEGRHWCWG